MKAKNRIHSQLKGEFRGLAWFINRIQSCFFRQLTALRKHGPISDLMITRDTHANVYLLKMGYQMVKITEGSPENTLWYCRYCGGGLAVTDLKVASNHEEGLETGDKVFNEELNADELKSVVKLKLTETHHLSFTKAIIESDLHEGAT